MLVCEHSRAIVSDPFISVFGFPTSPARKCCRTLFRYCSSFLSRRNVPESLTLRCIPFPGTKPQCWSADFPRGSIPGQATLIAAELVHDDYAYVFEAHWDLWTPDGSNANWVLEPAP